MANDGTINLGKSPEKMDKVMAESPEKKTYYPTLHIRDVDGLYDLPDGEFTFTGVAKKISSETRELSNGKEVHSCKLEIHSIKPSTKKEKKSKGADERLDDSLDKIAKKKSEEYEDEE